MSMQQAQFLGLNNEIKCSILKDDVASELWSKRNDIGKTGTGTENVTLGFLNTYYKKLGDNFTGKILSFNNGNNVVCNLHDNISFTVFLGEKNNLAQTVQNGYIKDGTVYGFGMAIVMTTSKDGTQYPSFYSFIFDDELGEAILLYGYYYFNASKQQLLCAISQISNVNNANTYNVFFNSFEPVDDDPWSNAGYAGIGGGDGTFDFKSDVIALPDIPSIDAVSSGFLQLFVGNLNKVLELSRYMWSTNFFDSVVKLTSNPIDIIMGLYMYPFIVPASTQKYIRAGNVITNISMGVPDSQILEIDCGSVNIPMFYGAYLDYEPFTKCDLFLPYCGTFPLSMDDIAGKTISIKYRIDLLTGVCGAYVIVDDSVKYNFTGTCAINIPISSRSFENIYNAIIGVVGSMHGGSSFGLPSVGSIAGAVTSGKNQIQHGGVCSGNAGYLGVQKPYLIFSVPNVAIPKGLNKYTGYPIYATYKLADLKGYTEIEEIHLENMGAATKEEIEKITTMLEGGVIL